MSVAPDVTASPAHEDSRTRFLTAMGQAATGVTVVATDGPHGRYAQTVSAMCSVSADPPTVLACVNRRSPLAVAAVRNGVFSVNVLAADQAELSDIFAGRPANGVPYDFGRAVWRREVTGAPVLADAAASFDCRVRQSLISGSHTVLLAAVEVSAVRPAPPLVYHARTYGTHHPLPDREHA